MSEWHITIALFGLWVLLRLRRAWFWLGPGSRQRIDELAEQGRLPQRKPGGWYYPQ